MNLFYTQEKVKNEIQQKLAEHSTVLLYGNSGTGKSSLVKKIAEESDFGRIIITEYSNTSFRNSNMKEFKLALSKADIKNSSGNDETLADAIVQDMSVAKNSLSHVIKLFKNNTLNRLEKEYFNIFSDDEKSLLVQLSKAARQNSLLLVFDNYHWANINDLNFIKNFSDICYNEKLFHNPIRIILIATDNQLDNPDFNFKEQLKSYPNVNLDHISADRYGEVLNRMGMAETLSSQVTGAIYSLTSGHLELTKRVVDYINTQGYTIFNTLEDIEKQTIIMMSDIFDQMIQFYFKDKQETISILEIASVIGNIFNRYEIKTLTQEELFLIEEQLSNAEGEHFIEINDDKAQFIHPIIRELFYKKLDDKRYTYHKKYAAELKILKPTEHLERAFHLKKCRDDATALWETMIACFFSILTQTHFPESNYQEMKAEVRKHKLYNYFTNMEQAFRYYSLGDVQRSLDCINSIDEIDIPTEPYRSLKNYLYARNLLLYKFDTNSFLQSAALLEQAKQCFERHSELELYSSSLMILLNIYAYKLCDIKAAQEIEKEIIDLHHTKLKGCIDYKMDDYLYEYKRKSASICTPEVAWKRTRASLEHFSGSDNIMELYKSSCDHSAACIFVGKFEEALKALKVCGQTVETYSILSFPETFKALNNYFLASLYSNPDSFWEQLDTVIQAYRQVRIENPYATKIIDVNLSGMLLLKGRLDEAEIILNELSSELTEYKSVFYYTFVYSNLASLCILRHDYDQATKCLSVVETHLDGWDDCVYKYYKKQLETLKTIIQQQERLTPQQLFMRPTKLVPEFLGGTWRFIGHGVLFSELLFYTT